MADPDLELMGGGGGGEGRFCFTCPARFSSFCDFFLVLPKIGVGGGGGGGCRSPGTLPSIRH